MFFQKSGCSNILAESAVLQRRKNQNERILFVWKIGWGIGDCRSGILITLPHSSFTLGDDISGTHINKKILAIYSPESLILRFDLIPKLELDIFIGKVKKRIDVC